MSRVESHPGRETRRDHDGTMKMTRTKLSLSWLGLLALCWLPACWKRPEPSGAGAPAGEHPVPAGGERGDETKDPGDTDSLDCQEYPHPTGVPCQ